RVDEYPDMALPEGRQMGFIAQELERVFPELVKESVSATLPGEQGAAPRETTAFKSVNYTGLVPVLVGAVQEEQAIIDRQDERIAALEARLDELARSLADVVARKR